MSNETNAFAIISAAQRYNLPAWIPLDIARRESGLNAQAVGDKGTSFGLFQLHRGGLAPSNLSDAQLMDPDTNANIAVKAMAGAYNRGAAQGLTGLQLEEYVANTSGWPGKLGVAWTNKNRADYNAGLSKIYGDNATEGYLADYSSSMHQEHSAIDDAVGGIASPDSYYEDSSHHSAAATVFRRMAEHENFESFSEWKDGKAWYEKIVPLGYLADNAAPAGVRALIIVIGLAFVLFAIWSIVKGQAAAAVGGGEPSGALPAPSVAEPAGAAI